MDDDLKKVVEAVLFASARPLEVAEIAKLCRRPEEDVRSVLKEWKEQLDEGRSPTMLVRDGDSWRLTVREKYASVVKKVVTKTELPKSILETLAVVAYKAPVLQSDVVKIRTNKAYDHLSFLEENDFITREKHGRTKMVRLTTKFFEYFDLDPSKLKKRFGNVSAVEKAIEEKEREIERGQQKQPEIILLSPKGKPVPLKVYPLTEPVRDLEFTGIEVVRAKVGELEVYGEQEEKPAEKPEDVPEEKPKVENAKEPEKSAETPEEEPAEEPETTEPEEPEPVEEPAEKTGEKPEGEPAGPEEKSAGEPKAEDKPEEAPEESWEEQLVEEIMEEAKKKEKTTFKGKGLYPKGVPEEMKERIDERVKQIMGEMPEEESSEEPENEKKKEEEE